MRSLYLLAFFSSIFYTCPILEGPRKSEARTVTFWSVGQGDFASITTSTHCYFFDAGGSTSISRLMREKISHQCSKKISWLFISHFDKDHIRNVIPLTRLIHITAAFFPHLKPKTRFGNALLEELVRRHVNLQKIDTHFNLKLQNFEIHCLWPHPNFKGFKDENSWSLVMQVSVGRRSFLFTGDLPTKIEKILLKQPIERATILKIGHHGSKSSTSKPFLEAVHPQACVVSVGRLNRYHHPTLETLKRLVSENCAILRTDRLGPISFLF